MEKIRLQKNLYEGKEQKLTQRFGENPKSYAQFNLKGHNGIDYALNTGTKLYSAIYGTVTETLNDVYGYGIYVKIENEYCGVLYAHLREFSLKVGDKLAAGDFVGFSGNTGNSTGPHLHFGVFPIPRDRNNGYAGYIDPLGSLVEWVDKLEDVSIKAQLKRKDLEIAELRLSRNNWKQDCQKISEELEIANKEIKNLNIKNSECVNNNKILTSGNLSYNEENNSLKAKIEALELELKDTYRENVNFANQVKQLKEKNIKSINTKEIITELLKRIGDKLK